MWIEARFSDIIISKIYNSYEFLQKTQCLPTAQKRDQFQEEHCAKPKNDQSSANHLQKIISRQCLSDSECSSRFTLIYSRLSNNWISSNSTPTTRNPSKKLSWKKESSGEEKVWTKSSKKWSSSKIRKMKKLISSKNITKSKSLETMYLSLYRISQKWWSKDGINYLG